MDNPQRKKGIWLDASFIVSDDNGNSYVWVSEKGKLKKEKWNLVKPMKKHLPQKSSQD